MVSDLGFFPEWASPPGDTITEILSERAISVEEFARQMGHTRDAAVDLLHGRTAITISTARRLGEVLGASVEFWMSRDFQYREDLARLRTAKKEWLASLPIKDMLKFGWLESGSQRTDLFANCLRYFGVPSLRAWRNSFADGQEAVAFRTSPAFVAQPGAVAAWLRRGEIESAGITCQPWNPEGLRNSIAQIRALTRQKDPSRFLPELKRICAESGVAVVVVRAPSGCRASGATRFLGSGKAMILLSFRYLTDDHFWFTFFHEMGHLLLHANQRLFLEEVGVGATLQEQEANEFAANILVPQQYQEALALLPLKSREVIRFARQIGVSPDIIVGQLQHRKIIKHHQLNRLKARYQWDDPSDA